MACSRRWVLRLSEANELNRDRRAFVAGVTLGDEIANAVAFLTSSAADYINRATLVGGVDGVNTARVSAGYCACFHVVSRTAN